MCVINKPLFHHLTNISKHTQALCFFALFAPKSDIKLSPVFPVFSEALCSVCRPVRVMCCMHKGLSLLSAGVDMNNTSSPMGHITDSHKWTTGGAQAASD